MLWLGARTMTRRPAVHEIRKAKIEMVMRSKIWPSKACCSKAAAAISFAVKQLALLHKQCFGYMCHRHLVLVQARLGSTLSTMWRLALATTPHRAGHAQKQDWVTPSRSLDLQAFQILAVSIPLGFIYLFACPRMMLARMHQNHSTVLPLTS